MRFALAIALVLSGLSVMAAPKANADGRKPVPPATNSVPAKAEKPAKRQCEAITLSGNRCKRRAMHDSPYCSQHAAIVRKRAGNQPRSP